MVIVATFAFPKVKPAMAKRNYSQQRMYFVQSTCTLNCFDDAK